MLNTIPSNLVALFTLQLLQEPGFYCKIEII